MKSPQIPDFFDSREQITENPEHWSGGRVRHTGGGIYCREWERNLPRGRRIEVVYSDEQTGIGVNHYPNADEYGVDDSTGGLAVASVYDDSPDVHSDEGYAEAAKRLMLAINMAVCDEAAETDVDLQDVSHGPVYRCECGETFESERARDRHAFNERAQQFIEEQLGEPFASYHSEIKRSMCGISAWETCSEEGIEQEITDENVKEAALAFCRSALVPPNSDVLLDR